MSENVIVFGPEMPQIANVGIKRKNGEISSDDDDSVSDSESGLSLSNFPKETITPQLTRWGTIPRLLKQDLRRNFGQALLNVINSHDRRLVTAYGRQFFVPAAEVHFPEEYMPVVSTIIPFRTLMRGREAWILHMNQLCGAVPDLVASITNYRVRRWDTTRSSQIIFHLHMEGNSVSHIDHKSEVASSHDKMQMEESYDDDASGIVSVSSPTSSSESTFATGSVDSADSHSSAGLSISNAHFSPAFKMTRLRVDAEITLHLDESMYITRITQRALIAAEKPLAARA